MVRENKNKGDNANDLLTRIGILWDRLKGWTEINSFQFDYLEEQLKTMSDFSQGGRLAPNYLFSIYVVEETPSGLQVTAKKRCSKESDTYVMGARNDRHYRGTDVIAVHDFPGRETTLTISGTLDICMNELQKGLDYWGWDKTLDRYQELYKKGGLWWQKARVKQ